jgi:hypothetical protein
LGQVLELVLEVGVLSLEIIAIRSHASQLQDGVAQGLPHAGSIGGIGAHGVKAGGKEYEEQDFFRMSHIDRVEERRF